MWEQFGFSQNPYDHLPISANAEGERLLVGREEELEKLILRIKGRNAIPTLEGDIGVGKTSIISVAAYKLETEFLKSGGSCYLALERPLQLESTDTSETFSFKVYQQILVKLHKIRADLIDRGMNIGETKKLYDWLMSAQYANGSLSAAGFGGGIGTSPNSSEGFVSHGFQGQVDQLLMHLFPNKKRGGMICIIDNLELLEKSAKAKATLEAMRDKVLTAHGIIWVICGARGIVRGVASSPRLSGYMAKPLQVEALPVDRLEGLIDRRITEYELKSGSGLAPVEEKGFIHVFKICNDNLRMSLKLCSDFSEWLLEQNINDLNSEKKFEFLEIWLAEETDEILRDTKLTPKPWEVFGSIVTMGGSVAPSDHQDLGFETQMAMRPHIKTLEDVGLVDSTIDETDQRRRTIALTPKGWLVNYSREGYPKK